MAYFPVLDRLRSLDELEAGREKRRAEIKALQDSRRQKWGDRNEERGGGVLREVLPPLDRVPTAALDEHMIQRSIHAVMPKAGHAAISAMGRIFAGLVPSDEAIRVPVDGKSASAMIRAMLRVKTSEANRHAVPLLKTYVGSYDVQSCDGERLRVRATMAVRKVVTHLRGRGYPVGVACATVDGTILAVPYLIDPAAPSPR